MFSQATPVVRNLLIVNGIFYLVTHVLFTDLAGVLAGYYPSSPQFQPWQVITHMFMHAGLGHLFFNMFALFMFGSQLERVWGPKRFLNYYLACGLGAFFLHEVVVGYGFYSDFGTWFPRIGELYPNLGYSARLAQSLKMFVPVVGASGAVYGLLLGFGMLFPNTRLDVGFFAIYVVVNFLFGAVSLGILFLIYFLLPRERFSIPLKAKYVVVA